MMTADLIKEARLRSHCSQAELGRRIGQSQSVIARWESGRVTPSLDTLRTVVRACDLEVSISLSRADDSNAALMDVYLRMTPAERFSEMMQRTRVRERRAQMVARRGP